MLREYRKQPGLEDRSFYLCAIVPARSLHLSPRPSRPFRFRTSMKVLCNRGLASNAEVITLRHVALDPLACHHLTSDLVVQI